MGLSAGRAEDYVDGNRNARTRRPRVMIISAVFVSVVIGVAATGVAMLDYQPAQQHVQLEITLRTP